MAIQIVPILIKLINALAVAGGAKMGLDALGITGGGLEEATAEIEKKQAAEYGKARGVLRSQAETQDLVSKMTPDPNELMTMATMLQSGAYDDQIVGKPSSSMVMHVAQRLGKTPEELASRTRPSGSPRQFLESGGY